MTNPKKNNETGIQADNNSIAVGGISAGGDISGNIHIGNIYNYASEEDVPLTSTEIEVGLVKFTELITDHAPSMEKDFTAHAKKLRATLGAEINSLSLTLKTQREDGVNKIGSICMEVLDISFQALCRGQNPPPYDSRPPFRGLYAFRAEDEDFYFGREVLIQKLADRLKEYPFLAVLGASGSGKSSLVMAGLVSLLEAQIAYLTPTDSPLHQLKISLDKADKNAIIVVDQFEELFTLTRDTKEREEFIHQLLDLLKSHRVVVTMRADFWGEVASHKNLKQVMQVHQELIAPMDIDELRSAMEQQAAAVGLRFDPALSETILEEVKGEPGAMPLLQHALWMLWRRRHGLWLRMDEYQSFGGVKQAIASTAEDVYVSCSEFEQERMRDIFLRLTRLDDSNEGRDTRRRVEMNDLIPSGRDSASITLLLDKLANARLIVKTIHEEQIEIEVAHEALIRHWDRLRNWLYDDRENLRLRESVSENAKEWEAAERDKTLLNHRGGRLDDALLLGQNPRYGFTATEQAYLNECINSRNQSLNQRRRLQRQIISGLTGFTTIALVLLIFALLQLNISRAQKLGYQAQVAFAVQNYNAAQLYAYQSKLIHKNEAADLILSQIVYKNFPGGRGLNGHIDRVRSVAWSADGQLASGSDDTTVIIWDLKTYRPAQTLTGHTDIVYGVAWSAAGQLASASKDGTVIIWNLKTGQPSQILKGHIDSVQSVAWSASGQLASASNDGAIIIWDLNTGQPAQTLRGHKDAVNSVDWSANGILASGSNDKTVIIWDTQTGQPVQFLQGHTDAVQSVAWSADGQLASGSDDSTVILWDLKMGQPKKTLKGHTTTVYSVDWSTGGQLASGSRDTTVILWDLNIEQPIQTLNGHTDLINSIAWSSDDQLASGSLDNTVTVWNLKTNPSAQTLIGHTSWVNSVSWSPDGQLATGSDDGNLILWNLKNNQPDKILMGNTGGIYSVAWSPSGQLASGSEDGTLILWDINAEKPSQTLIGHKGPILEVAWSADGQLASGSDDTTVIIWDLETGKPAKTLKGHTDMVNSVAWSPKGQLATGSNDGTVIIWDTETGIPKKILNSNKGAVYDIAWSADNQLASGTYDGYVVIWDLNTSQPKQSLKTPTIRVYSVAWAPSGLLASASSYGNTVIWDVQEGKPTQTLMGHATNRVINLAWSPDGKLTSGSEDRTIKILNADMIGFDPCDKIIRNMSLQEWLDYQGDFYIYKPACPNLYNPSTELNPLKSLTLETIQNRPNVESLALFGTWKGRVITLTIFLALLAAIIFIPWALYKSALWASLRIQTRNTLETK